MLDDDTSSLASFEDVGASSPPSKSAAAGREVVIRAADDKVEDEVIPDILYVVQYRDNNGSLVGSECPLLSLLIAPSSPSHVSPC